MHTCKACNSQFSVTEEDLKFYARFSSPAPTLCPECRQQRRLAYRNERKFYKRNCSATGKPVISIYSADKPCVVYGQETWWSDSWDPMKYGRDFDFNRPFFEQFNELSLVVPRPCTVSMSSENSTYTNHSAYNKNCYMCINTGYSEDLFYCTNYAIYNKDCADCLGIQNCEMCYFCTDTKKSSFCSYLHECMNCVSSAFLFDCRDCHDCFGCWNLRHKQYCIFNVQYPKDEYIKKLQEVAPRSFMDAKRAFESFQKLIREKAIHRATIVDLCENSTGDHLINSKNVQNSYYTFESEDCSYCHECGKLKVSRDATEPFQGELQFESHGCNLGYDLMACSKCYENNVLRYCQYCWYCSNLFGCFGLRRKQYCILNKQYSKEEYEKLVIHIIEHMGGGTASACLPAGRHEREREADARLGLVGSQPSKAELKNKEFGEFFPMEDSPFGYNETAAQEYRPLTKEQALARGLKWKDEEDRNPQPQTYVIPDNISDVKDNILDQVLACKKASGNGGVCCKNYRIIAEELKFYKKSKLPIPEYCPDCRHAERISLRSSRSLFERPCTSCGNKIFSTHPASGGNTPKNVYCEKCYLATVY